MAVTRFLDFTLGNDANDGLTAATAWKNISKVASGIVSGDTVKFKRGEIWQRPATFTFVGGATYTDYGTGNLPILEGADLWVGAWSLQAGSVYKQTGVTTVDSASGLLWEDGVKGVRQTSIAAVTQAGFYFLDDPANTLYYWSRTGGGGNPTGSRVHLANNNSPFQFSGSSGTINNIYFRYAAGTLASGAASMGSGWNFNGCHFSSARAHVCSQGAAPAGISVTFRVCEFDGAGSAGFGFIWIAGIQNSLVEDCLIHDNAGVGLVIDSTNNPSNNILRRCNAYANGSDGLVINMGGRSDIMEFNNCYNNGLTIQDRTGLKSFGQGTIIRYNRCYDNNLNFNIGTGIQLDTQVPPTGGAQNCIIHHNECWNNANAGISVTGNGHQIYNNTLAKNRKGGMELFTIGDTCNDLKVKNNIFADNGNVANTDDFQGRFCFSDDNNLMAAATGVEFDYNWIQKWTGGTQAVAIRWAGVDYATLAAFKAAKPSLMVHGQQGDPLLLAPASFDFHLQASSPCIDAAVILTGISDTYNDFAPDIGRWEAAPAQPVPPPHNLPGGLSGMDLSRFGQGPGGDTGLPIWRFMQVTPTVANVQSMIATADALDLTLLLNFSGNRGQWTNPDANGNLIFDLATYKSKVDRYANIPEVADAIARGRVLNFTIDEPFLPDFAGTIPKNIQNDLGLYHKQIWPGCWTFMRSPASQMTPPPSGGWTGVDYGTAQFNKAASASGLTKRQWFDRERASLLAVNCGCLPAFNWLNCGDGRLWDYLNTGSSVGRIQGTNSSFWLASPSEIDEATAGIWDDADAPGFTGWTFADAASDFPAFQQYQFRSDFVAAWDRQLNKFKTRPTFNGLRPSKGAPVPPPPGTGKEIDHSASLPVVDRQTTISATYTDIPGAVILAGDLTAGKQYLVVVAGAIDFASAVAGKEAYTRVVSGSTLLPRSESAWRPVNTSSRLAYFHWGIHTAVSGEDLKMQYKNNDGVTTVGAQFCTMFAMNITDDLVNGVDYKFAESAASTTLTTTFQDGASITFTPATAGQDWLVLTSAHYQAPSITQSLVSGLRRAGEAIEIDPEVQVEGRDAARDLYRLTTAKVVTLGAVTNTFAEHSKNTGGGGPRDGSAVFALRLNRFAAHGFTYDNTEIDLVQTPDYGTPIGTAILSIPDDTDIWSLGGFGMVITSQGSPVRARLQVGGLDSPTGQSGALTRFDYSYDATDVQPLMIQTLTTFTGAGGETVEMDASLGNSAAVGRGARGRLVMGVTTLLTAPIGTSPRFRRSQGDIGTRTGTRKLR